MGKSIKAICFYCYWIFKGDLAIIFGDHRQLSYFFQLIIYRVDLRYGLKLYNPYLPRLGLIGPAFGGFIAVYMVDVRYTNGILYGGLPISLAGLTSAPLLVFLSQYQTHVQLNVEIPQSGIMAIYYIVGTISNFIEFLFIGIVCGIIAVAVQKKD